MSEIYVVWGEHPGEDTGYYLGASDTDAGAVRVALSVIAERVGNDWSDYNERDVERFRSLLAACKLSEALDHWNNMSGFAVDIETVSFYKEEESDLMLEFQWS